MRKILLAIFIILLFNDLTIYSLKITRDKKGRKKEIITRYPNGNINKRIRYNKYGEVIEEAEYYPEGILKKRFTFKYDERGNMIERAKFFEVGMKSKFTYKYNNKNIMIEKVKYNPNNTKNYKIEYDDWGSKIRKTKYNPDGSVGFVKYF